jgi:hypothetical protein
LRWNGISYTGVRDETNRLSKKGWGKCKICSKLGKVISWKGVVLSMKEKMLEIIKDNEFFSLESPKWSRLIVDHIPWDTEEEFKK